jgi:Na+/H+ antiporter NhaD/arsenite permease-like protein
MARWSPCAAAILILWRLLALLVPFSVIPSKTVGNVPAVALPGQALDNISPPVLNALAVFSAQTDNPLLTGSLGNNIDAEWAHAQRVRLTFGDSATVGIPQTAPSIAVATCWFYAMRYLPV